jgi:hypothetical protein
MNVQSYSHKSTYNATQITFTLQKHGAGSVLWVACMLGSYSYVNNPVQVDEHFPSCTNNIEGQNSLVVTADVLI